MELCNQDGKEFFHNLQTDFKDQEKAFDKDYNKKKAQEAKRLSEDKKKINQKKKEAKKCASKKSKKPKIKMCPCPVCAVSNMVKDKIAGKNYFSVPFSDFKVPRFDHLVESTPTFDQNRREGEACGACKGTKQIPDVADDSAKYQQVAQKLEEKSGEILEREAKLGLGGTRTTFIQGSDLLFVGLGFNNNKTYETIPEGSIAPTMKGGKIPQQNATPVNAVVGKQGTLGWPQQVGNYTIKCANKFSLLAGAGGITIATPGPLTFSAGMLKFVGPQLSLGCANGPLSLEGESVNIAGKAISMTPTGGELFVKGNVSNTGNMTVQGHAHFESASFAKASCVGVTKSTYTAKANPDVTQTQPAVWGAKALQSSLLDLQTYYQNVPVDSKTSSFRLQSPKENQNISDRMGGISNTSREWEPDVTGFIIPGTTFQARINGGAVVTVEVITKCDLHNKPHVHGMPEMMHKHEMMMPDMDYTNDSTQSLRAKVLDGNHESGAPADPTKDTATRLAEVKRTGAEFSAATQVEGTKNVSKGARFKNAVTGQIKGVIGGVLG